MSLTCLGSRLEFSCIVKGNPLPKVIWRKGLWLEICHGERYDVQRDLETGECKMVIKASVFLKKLFIILRYYAEACNEWWGPSSWLNARATQLRKNVEAAASRWQHCSIELARTLLEFMSFRAHSVAFHHYTCWPVKAN